GRWSEAEATYSRALHEREKLAAEHPERLQFTIDLGGTLGSLGMFILAKGDPLSACGWFDRSVATLRPVPGREPRTVEGPRFLRNAYWKRAEAHSRLGNHARAAGDWGEAIALEPGPLRDQFRLDRALTLARSGDHARASEEAESLAGSKAIPPGPRFYDL